MTDKRNFSARLRKARERAREDGLSMVFLLLLRTVLEWIGIKFNPFYYMQEKLPANLPAALKAIPAEYEFSFFGPEELAYISTHPERKGYVPEQYVYDNHKAGDSCYGCKIGGEIAGFTWFSLTGCRDWLYQAPMHKGEAYLYDIFVFKAFRGKKLSLILRYKNYELLRDLGRHSFYSITDYTNKASFEFKQRLNSKIVFKGLQIQLFGKIRKCWIIKKYPD
jgi:hypothetical protein